VLEASFLWSESQLSVAFDSILNPFSFVSISRYCDIFAKKKYHISHYSLRNMRSLVGSKACEGLWRHISHLRVLYLLISTITHISVAFIRFFRESKTFEKCYIVRAVSLCTPVQIEWFGLLHASYLAYLPPWRWRPYVSPKHQWTSTGLHSVIS
jgi:hypothetical protein